jgi:hypothetical protein
MSKSKNKKEKKGASGKIFRVIAAILLGLLFLLLSDDGEKEKG